MTALSPEILLRAYAVGLFPMAERRNDPTLYWIDPEKRGILPLESFHVPRRLRRTVRNGPYQVTADTAFEQVIEACAATLTQEDGSPPTMAALLASSSSMAKAPRALIE